MIFSCGETWEATIARLGNWHRFFVLWPRTIGIQDGQYQCVWLQYVERRGDFYCNYADCGWAWEYRLID